MSYEVEAARMTKLLDGVLDESNIDDSESEVGDKIDHVLDSDHNSDTEEDSEDNGCS